MTISVETQRFILREIRNEDAQGLFALDSDPEVHKYLGNMPVTTLKECQDVVKHIQKQYKENGIGRWAIIDKATNDFVGWTGLKYEKGVREGIAYYDLGYRLIQKYWGKGIATETAIASLQYGFTQMNLDEICAAAHVDNIASNKILQKVGLSFVETFDVDGEAHNWYSLKKSTFKKIE